MFPTNPTIAIVGAGALGGYFGVRLALAGLRVRFLMRGDLSAVRYGGLRLELEDGTVHKVTRPDAHGSTAAIGPSDLVLIALKTTQNACLPATLGPLMRPHTVLLTLQNGLGNAEFLRRHFPDNPVIGGLCQIGVNRVAPGVIRNFIPGGGSVQLAALDPEHGELAETVAALFDRASIRAKTLPSLGEATWRKLMWNVPFNGLTILAGGVSTDCVVNTPALRTYARELMEELRAAAGKLGHSIEAEYTDKLLEFTDRMKPYRPSSLVDFLEGKEIEVEAIFGEPLRQGEAAGVPMPRLSALDLLLRGVKSPAAE
ncbi:MAG: 2-dehydropantoate 2-reductase [Opitutales bacterium]|nr:2-dehydropantoate 2-reductase [Opitutales bacterium]